MKKVLLTLVLLFALVLTGCEGTAEEHVDSDHEFGAKISELETSLNDAVSEIDDLQTDLDEATVAIDGLTEENEMLLELVKSTNTRIKNALDRDNWATRKIGYNADFTTYEAEYCLGVFESDWSLEADSDYKHNGGLKFVITIEEIVWGTEIFVKDSCGNYSEFVYQSSPYSMYSIPADYFEVGKTYEVVLYKEVYFTVAQLGLLPLADLGDFGAFPTDLSGIIANEVN